jgi:hypothetical protein
VCNASSGYFTLSFRQYVTEHILFDDTAATVKAKLEVACVCRDAARCAWRLTVSHVLCRGCTQSAV